MSNIGQELLKIKERLEKDKEKRAELQGEYKGLMERLQNDYGVSTLEEGKKLLISLENDIEQTEKELERGVKKIQKMLDGEEEE